MKSLYAVALATLAMPVYAQPMAPVAAAPSAAVPVVAGSPIALQPTDNAILRAGTPIALRLMEEITTKAKSARVGQRFMLEVAAPVEVNGVTVIPQGTPAWGEITGVRNKGMWGKSGKLDAHLLFLRVDGRQIRLTGAFDDKGVTGTAGVVGAIALVPIAGFFMTGTSALLPKGGAVSGFIDEDVTLAFKQAAIVPMAVAAAPTPVPATVENAVLTQATPAPAVVSVPVVQPLPAVTAEVAAGK